MKRVMLGTSVYGLLAKDKLTAFRLIAMVPREIVIYGLPIIRKELRNTPKEIMGDLFTKNTAAKKIPVKKTNENKVFSSNKLFAMGTS